MEEKPIYIEKITGKNREQLAQIQRDDISEAFVDSIDTILELTEYGITHGCVGNTWAIKAGEECIGVLLLGEALAWETDPKEMRRTPFYRLMGFVMDRRYRNRGIGGNALESVIAQCYAEYGVRPIALGVHKDNHKAADFYLRHGFQKTEAMEGNDYYYLRYPAE